MPNSALHLTPAEPVTPYFREAMMILDEVERFAHIGEFFEAGCWWRDVLRPLEHVQDKSLRHQIEKRMGEVSERIVEAQRRLHLQAATGDCLRSVRQETAAAGAFGL